jgi:hypothetical protein
VGVKMGVGKGNISEECVGDGVYIYTLERGGVRAVFTNWGAILMSLCVPDAQGAYEHTHNFCTFGNAMWVLLTWQLAFVWGHPW